METEIKYILYARKSTESEDRQVQSLDDQVSLLKALAERQGLKIVDVYIESKTAKMPNCRPLFNEMVSRIEKGEADGILCWAMNRLFRNPVDQGSIGWMLQRGVIRSIQTFDKQYLPDDNVLLFNVEGGMANQYIIDLRKACMRGLKSKVEKGWRPGVPPMGYRNNKDEGTIEKDEALFPVIRKMWDLLLSEEYSVRQVWNIAIKDWGFRTPKFKRTGGKEPVLSAFYRMFTNIFYTGMFEYQNQLHSGKHDPMITIDEFDKVQKLLGRKGKPRPQKHIFPYSGLIKCGVCGCQFCGTKKLKLVKNTGELKSYTYFACTRKKLDSECYLKGARPITEKDLEEQIIQEIHKSTISKDFFELALDVIDEEKETLENIVNKIHEQKERSLNKYKKELQNLVQMRYRELIDDEIYLTESNRMTNKIKKLEFDLKNTNPETDTNLNEEVKKAFYFCLMAKEWYISPKAKDKRIVLNGLGSNYTIISKILSFTKSEWLIPIEEFYNNQYVEYRRFELKNNLTNKRRKEFYNSFRLQLRSTIEDVKTKLNRFPITIPEIDRANMTLEPLLTTEKIEQNESLDMAA